MQVDDSPVRGPAHVLGGDHAGSRFDRLMILETSEMAHPNFLDPEFCVINKSDSESEGYYGYHDLDLKDITEGTASEWWEIAKGIRNQSKIVKFEQCAVIFYEFNRKYDLWSPKSRSVLEDFVSFTEANAHALADAIESMFVRQGERCIFGVWDPVFAGA